MGVATSVMLAAGGLCSFCRSFSTPLVSTEVGGTSYYLCGACSAASVLANLLAEARLTGSDRAIVGAQLGELIGFVWARIPLHAQRELANQPAVACLQLVPDELVEPSSSSDDSQP